MLLAPELGARRPKALLELAKRRRLAPAAVGSVERLWMDTKLAPMARMHMLSTPITAHNGLVVGGALGLELRAADAPPLG